MPASAASSAELWVTDPIAAFRTELGCNPAAPRHLLGKACASPLPPRLTLLARQDADDPKILETWL